MLLDFDIQSCTRQCAATSREIKAGETFYSTLVVEQGNVVRQDYSTEGWAGPPEGALGWWKCKLPGDPPQPPRLAPNDVLLELFDRWSRDSNMQDACYVLALLLLRRRVFRADESMLEEPVQTQCLRVYCPRREATYEIPEADPSDERGEQIQQILSDLLYASGSGAAEK